MIEGEGRTSFSPAGRRSRQGDEGKTASTGFARHLRREQRNPEHLLWSELRGRRLNGFKFVRQFAIGPYVADFACRTNWLIVELDGNQHADSARDDLRTKWLNERFYSVLRFWNAEFIEDRAGVLDTILAVLEGRLRASGEGADPSPDLRFAQAALSPPGRGMAPLSSPFLAEAR